MDKFFSQMETFLSHPILWGVLALLAFAFALSGRLSLTAATWVLWIAWGASVFGVFRAETPIRDPLVKYLILVIAASTLALGAVFVQRWFEAKAAADAPAPV